MQSLGEWYIRSATTPSDINEHVAYLFDRASTLSHITEFGTRLGVSTTAFLMAKPSTLHCYDTYRQKEVDDLLALAQLHGIYMVFHEEDVRIATIEETDLLFIDTYHVADQLQVELERHHTKVRRYIILHDTETFGERGEDPEKQGLQYALKPFLARYHDQWRLIDHRPQNNGLTTLERIHANH